MKVIHVLKVSQQEEELKILKEYRLQSKEFSNYSTVWELDNSLGTPQTIQKYLDSTFLTSCVESFGKTLHHSDLVPFDFWLFPKLKLQLKGKIFETVQD